MPTIQDSGAILTSIGQDLADNNAGLISAEDVRHNMEDTVASISRIVASGDTETEYPFYNNVTVRHIPGDGNGLLYVESGIYFPNSSENPSLLQEDPYPGNDAIDHGQLAPGSLLDDDHPQYMNLNGTRSMDDNLGVGTTNWINSSGLENGASDDRGIQFVYQGDHDDLYIGTSGKLEFNLDNTYTDSFHGLAKAWLSFDASGNLPPDHNAPVIKSYYNVENLTKDDTGKFTITFNSGVFEDNKYVALGLSNATSTSGSQEDMDLNTVGIVLRTGNDGPDDVDNPRKLTFVVQNDGNQYIDAQNNDLVVYGYNPGSKSGVVPTVTNNA